jgi:hypothetical protein
VLYRIDFPLKLLLSYKYITVPELDTWYGIDWYKVVYPTSHPATLNDQLFHFDIFHIDSSLIQALKRYIVQLVVAELRPLFPKNKTSRLIQRDLSIFSSF